MSVNAMTTIVVAYIVVDNHIVLVMNAVNAAKTKRRETMELEFPKVEIETSDNFKTKSFGFGDKRVIINILRSKMYSDPIYIICQEIMSNSRDAHRELGIPSVPVVVHLPSRFNETIRFQDFGPGITPDRMENVFILYGQSTKRIDNVQTGGFGLGAKTPFAYTDSFNIITITEDSDGRHKREYIAYIDETQIGAMSLLKTTLTDERTGTTIAVPIKKADFKRFEQDVLRISKYWDVRPTISGANKSWTDDVIEFEGTNWHMAQGDSSYGYRYSHNCKPLVIIDGIQYPLKTDVVSEKIKDSVACSLSKRDIRLFFKTGELKVTANREDLDYQPEVIAAITARVHIAVKELRAEVDKSVINAVSLRDAIRAWSKAEMSFKQFMVKPRWKGLELKDSWTPSYSLRGDVEVFVYERVDRVKFKAHRKRYYGSRALHAKHDWVLFEHDDDSIRPHVRKIRTLFADNPAAQWVGGIKFKTDAARTSVESDWNFSKLDPIKLSDIVKAKIIRAKGAGGGRGAIVPVKILTTRQSDRVGTVYEWAKAPGVTVADSGIFVTLYSGNQFIDSDRKNEIERCTLHSLSGVLGVPVYGVLSRAASKLDTTKWTPLSDKCDEVIKHLEANADVKNYLTRGEKHTLKLYASKLWEKLLDKQDTLTDKTGVLYRYIEESKKSAAGKGKVNKLHAVQSLLRKTKTVVKSATMKKLKEEFIALYPLANAVTDGYDRDVNRETVVEEIISYANMKDAQV